MTLGEAIDRVQNRAGLSESSATYTTRARSYLSMIAMEVSNLVPWWWLDRTTTFDTVASTRTYTPIASQITALYSLWDEDNERHVDFVTADEYDALDPEHTDEGTVEAACVEGVDATTGYPVIGLWRVPSAVVTIRIRYRIEINEWTSSNDSSDFLALGIPRLLENALVYGATGLVMEENGDEQGAAREGANMARIVELAKKRNLDMVHGDRRFLPLRGRGSPRPLIQVGTSLAEDS